MHHAFVISGDTHDVWLSRQGGAYRLHRDGTDVSVALEPMADGAHRLTIGAEIHTVSIAIDGDDIHVHVDGASHRLRYVDAIARYTGHHGPSADDVVLAPMPGTVVAVPVTPGDAVARGDILIVIESMKLETAVKAWRDGTVATVHQGVGRAFERSAPLITLAPEE